MADMFEILEEDEESVEIYLKEMDPQYAADMLSEMYTDNAVDILNQLDKTDLRKYLNMMTVDNADEIKELLHYEDETAGSIMTTEYVSVL